jgi:enoyl-CoA hydratase/carnithine racemase
VKIHTEQYSPAYWRVLIDNPPINIFDLEMSDKLQALLTKPEADEAIKVVVFESANSDYIL